METGERYEHTDNDAEDNDTINKKKSRRLQRGWRVGGAGSGAVEGSLEIGE